MGFNIVQTIVVVVTFIVFVYILWSVPKRQVKALGNLSPEERLKIENETRKIMAEILGGACILVGLIFTWETVKGTAESLRISQEGLQVSQKSLMVTQEGQNTEQFIRAIEQLGKGDEDGKEGHLAIRLGGIRGLERLADTSSKDYWPIMEILTTYIRDQARWRADNKLMGSDTKGPKPEIQAILSVLGNRSKSRGEGEVRVLNLRGVDLRRASLEMLNFDSADLSLAHLENAILKGSKLRLADLKGAYLNGADLEQAQLEGARLNAVDFSGANLFGAVFKDANLSQADFRGARLDAANLSGANLTGAVFKGAEINEADFRGAILNGAELIGVNLKNAKNLTREQIKSAKTDQTTQLPDGL